MIQIQIDDRPVAPGGVLRGRIVARCEGQKAPRAVVVEAGWRTEGRGSRDQGDVLSQRLEPRGGHAEIDEPFEVPIPAAGPCSYDGDLLRIIWELRVRLDIPWGRDETTARPFVVSCVP